MDAPKHYSYSSFGLYIRSELQLPELQPAESPGLFDVTIRRGQVPFPAGRLPGRGRDIRVTADGVFLYWSEIGFFWVKNGQEIIFHPHPGVIEDIIRLPLLGVVLGTLLHQRGFFTLHASAVSVKDAAIAFVGLKGAGKSTMAAALHARGHNIITDDVLALDLINSTKGEIRAIPGFPHIKLWPDASETLGNDSSTLPTIHPRVDKRGLRPEHGFQNTPVPLKRIYTLSRGENLESKQLSLKEAFLEILTHSYAARFLGDDGAGPDHFKQCTKLVQHIPVHRLRRPENLDQLYDSARFIEDEIAASNGVNHDV